MSSKRMSKSQFVTVLSEKSGLSEKQTVTALDTINLIIAQELGKQGPGEVLIPGLFKLSLIDKPATPKHKGINPFTKEPMIYKAKAAYKVIKVRLHKSIKDAI
jgi:nucleoid DNA-binding protein